MVFDLVITATFEELRYVDPLVAVKLVSQEQDPLLFLTPLAFFNARVQDIVPMLAALLCSSAAQVLSD